MSNPYDIFKERGFIYQCTDDEGLRRTFETERVTAYVGFDATADSLHVGSLIPIMALAWLQKTGHRPIAIVGGGTTMVGDPSGKTEARQILSRDQIKRNMEGLKSQLSQYLEFAPEQALMIDNGDWLLGLNYIDFLRDVGRHFSINRMLASESYRMRYESESGLSFIEFNYMLLQAYDFLVLFQDHGCRLQMGGQDQWGNIVAGIDLIRRVRALQTHGVSLEEAASGGLAFERAYGLTFPLLMDPKSGEKFGKTHKGAVWLDKDKTPPYEFFQFWRNAPDEMVGQLLGLFTFLPMDEVRALTALEGKLINRAKEILAYEVTALNHGHQEASKAYSASIKTFGPADPEGRVRTSSRIAGLEFDLSEEVPTTTLTSEQLTQGLSVLDLFIASGLASSKSEARRLVRGGGAYVNGQRIEQEDRLFTRADLEDQALILRAGKKRYHRLLVQE